MGKMDLTANDARELLTAPYDELIRLSSCWGLRLRVRLENSLYQDEFLTFDDQFGGQVFLAKLRGRDN
jgi:hypothetical protein